MLRFVAGLSAAVIGFAVLPAQAQRAPGSVVGVVMDTAGHPLHYAEVIVRGTNLVARTGGDGSYAFPAVAEGLYTLRARLIGFLQAEVDTVRVKSGDTTRVDFRLRQPTGDIDFVIVPARFNPVCSADSAVAEGYRAHLERIYREQSLKAEITWSRSAELCRAAVLTMIGDSAKVVTDTPFVYTVKGVSGVSYAILTNGAVRRRRSEWAGVCFFDRQWRMKGVCLAV